MILSPNYAPDCNLKIENKILDLLFEDKYDLVLVLEHVFEVDDPVGVDAGGEHGNLVEDLHGAVDATANPFEICNITHMYIAFHFLKLFYLEENLAAYMIPVSLCVHFRTVAKRPLKETRKNGRQIDVMCVW